MKRVDIVVGPNGAGKSTFIAFTLAPLLPRSVIVNADEIAKQRWPDDPATHAYEAARIAADTRARLTEAGISFIAETVFSHPSKLEMVRAAHDAGYAIVLHVLLIPEALAVERVKRRVRHGGHGVPEDKIRERHRRLWRLVAQAMEIADTTTVYDNSRRKGPQIVAQLAAGTLIGAPAWPTWAATDLSRRWPA